VAQPVSEITRELSTLEAELKRLEAEYNMYFAGRLPRPPWETRTRVDDLVKRLDRTHIGNTGERFRFSTLQSRYASFVELWDRALRSREEGRPGPFAAPPPKAPAPPRPQAPRADDRVVHVATFRDPLREMDKLHDLYDRLAQARKEAGMANIPFHKFADLVKTQVGTLKEKGSAEVAFRVSVKDGKVSFTARPMKGAEKSER
jgi:hypothetical protein